MKFACAGAATLFCSTLWAQTPNQALLDLADQVKTALQQDDLERAGQLNIKLSLAIHKQLKSTTATPKEKLEQLEKAAPASGLERFYALGNLAKAAFDAGDFIKADAYAHELLSDAADYPKDWNDGNAIFFGNMVAGRVALRRDHDTESARSFLLAAGGTKGSPQLNSFGPNMSLAKDLLEAGERETVLEYFTLCRSFWKMGTQKLDDWSAAVKGGGMPDFGANLVY
jgi:hypothetical protein